jgi:hypothetical protein
MKRLREWFFGKDGKPADQPRRMRLSDVKPGQYINLEYHRVKGSIASVKCLNNDIATGKILIMFHWGNWKEINGMEYERIVFDYKDEVFKNFHLLNELKIAAPQTDEPDNTSTNIIELQKQMNDALSKEQYELADKLQKQIDNLVKK